MKTPKHLIIVGLALLLVTGCVSTGEHSKQAELDTLNKWMTGTFTSAAQSKEDPENFFPIRLVMMPIWTDRDDGPWLYVEQASETALERPYRQRVYRLQHDERGRLRSVVYTLPGDRKDALKHAACWKEETPLAGVTPDNLVLRKGCAIYLTTDEMGNYQGSTLGRGCGSSLGGAAYATSEVHIAPGLLTSWDRGYDSSDIQKWGAEKGPYRFVQISETVPNDK